MSAAYTFNHRIIKQYNDTKYNHAQAKSLVQSDPNQLFEITFRELSGDHSESEVTVFFYRNFEFGFCNFDVQFPFEIDDSKGNNVSKQKAAVDCIEWIDNNSK